ncbi:MAG: glycosyltransferase [Alphaproteobacteria bacterium]|nr:glycosyltransferase [Alphaproteobacteria bacterium]
MSVVIPAFNAAGIVGDCIDAILAQDYPRSRFEIIVVDNASTDDTNAVLRSYGGDVTVVEEARRGAAAARNAGMRRAGNQFIALTDADCVPEPSWLRCLLEAAHADPDVEFIGGPVRSLGADSEIERFGEKCFDHEAALSDERFPYAITGNVLFRRSCLAKVGYFDEGMRYGEDTELSFRALFHHKARFAYAPDAVVYHRNPRTVAALFVQGVKQGRAAAYLLVRYSADVGETPFGRAFRLRRWRRIAADLWRGARLSVVSDEADRLESRHCLYDATHNIGKQVGTFVQAVQNLGKTFPDPVAGEPGR